MASVLTFNGHGLKLFNGTSYVRVSGEKYDPVVYPYLLLQCDGYNNTHPKVSSTWSGDAGNGECVWTQVSTSPNVWKLEITKWATTALGVGLPFLFSSNASPPVGTIHNSCKLIGSGNMDVALDGAYCQSFDRMFAGCEGLEYIDPIHCTRLENVGGMFSGCTNVEGGALDQYEWFTNYGVNINNHSGTFTDCGSDTTTGASELAQIPVGWGGTLVPASTLMTSARQSYTGSNWTSWKITGNAPDWSFVKNGMYLFTEASVSSYSGVSMNRSRIPNGLNGLATKSGSPLYFYPAFVQCSKIPGQSGNSVSWLVTTDLPNGNLTASQGNTDMPGTLDYSSYGPFTREYGSYITSNDVYFTFLVTNVPIDSWNGLTDAMGFLYNSNFKVDGGFRYFF